MRIVDDTACILKREYGDELQLNLGGAIGIDQMMGAAAIEHEIRYVLYLPFKPEIQAKYWKPKQRAELDRQMSRAAGITIVNPNEEYHPRWYHERDRLMVNEADFTVGFWVGRRQGGTFETMKYSLRQSKMVVNAMDRMRLVFKQDLERGWTPPHLLEEASNDQ